MKPILLLATAVSTAIVSVGSCFAQQGPVLWNLDRINAKAELIHAGAKIDFYERLKHTADSVLTVETNPSVMLKTVDPRSGDMHDYMSMSRYTWPDPDSPDGLPYIFLDGRSNPELNNYDRPKLSHLVVSVEALSMVYYISGEQKYADKAVERLRAWFTDEQTRMNPHFEYGQIHKGYSNDLGAPAGILDGFSFVNMLDAVSLLELRGALPDDLAEGLRTWFGDLAEWMVTSENGIAESNVKHNHAIAYDTQLIRFAMYSGRDDIARRVIEEFPTRRFDVQVMPDGRMPAELGRTIAFFYSRYNIEHMVDICDMASKLGIHDLYTASNNAVDRAIGWIMPYAIDTAAFPYSQINSWDDAREDFARVIYRASRYSPDKAQEYKSFYETYRAEEEKPLFEFLYLD